MIRDARAAIADMMLADEDSPEFAIAVCADLIADEAEMLAWLDEALPIYRPETRTHQAALRILQLAVKP